MRLLLKLAFAALLLAGASEAEAFEYFGPSGGCNCGQPQCTTCTPACDQACCPDGLCGTCSNCCNQGCCASACCNDGCCDDGCCDHSCGWFGCGSCCKGGIFCSNHHKCCHTLLQARVNAVYMTRERHNAAQLATDGIDIDAADFDFGWQPGLDATFVYQPNPDFGIEGRYFWIDDWSSRITTPPTDEFLIVGDPMIPVTGIGAAAVQVDYRSEFQSGEISLRRQCSPFLNVTAGFRYAEFNERLSYSIDVVPRFADYRTRNNLYGFQLGADSILYQAPCGRFRVDGFVKAGIYYNDAEASLFALGFDDAVNVDNNGVAFLGEIGLYAGYNLTSCVTLRAGYQALWLDGVTTAPSFQLGSGGFPPTTMPLNDTVFIHGVSGGIEIRY